MNNRDLESRFTIKIQNKDNKLIMHQSNTCNMIENFFKLKIQPIKNKRSLI